MLPFDDQNVFLYSGKKIKYSDVESRDSVDAFVTAAIKAQRNMGCVVDSYSARDGVRTFYILHPHTNALVFLKLDFKDGKTYDAEAIMQSPKDTEKSKRQYPVASDHGVRTAEKLILDFLKDPDPQDRLKIAVNNLRSLSYNRQYEQIPSGVFPIRFN